MAHFAELDGNGSVLRVIVVPDEHESYGENWCYKLLGGRWKQTSYNSSVRKNYAGAGYKYDTGRDAFIPPKYFNSWVLDESTCRYKAPVLMPKDGKEYTWNEGIKNWEVR